MYLRYTLLLCALFLLCPLWAGAQPRPDPTRFNALETCNDSYLQREYVLSFGCVNAAGSFETIFYPGTRDAKGALAINVTDGKPVEVFMKIP